MRTRLATILLCAAVAAFVHPVTGHSIDPLNVDTLTVSATGGHFASEDDALFVGLRLTPAQRGFARVSIHAPARFALVPSRPPGSPVGRAVIDVVRSDGAIRRYTGTIAAAGAGTSPCADPAEKANWVIQARSGNNTIDLPIALVPDRGTRLEICPPRTQQLVTVALSLTYVFPPVKPGAYTWSAIVTPNTGRAYELRAIVAAPHVLRLRGTYSSSDHMAYLSGTLRRSGKPQHSATVLITRLDRIAVPPTVNDSIAATAQTNRAGTFRVKIPLARTAGFVATSLPITTNCSGQTQAPGGCRSTTYSSTESDPITVSIP